MNGKLTQKQKTFCLRYFESGNASEAAILAGYNPKYAATHTTRWLKMANIKQRIAELNKEVEDASVASVLERKQVATEIVRARLPDYITCGPDGDLIIVDSESPNTAALQEVTSRTDYNEDGAGTAVVTKIKLHNPLQAIDLLNKMDKIYTDGAIVNIDNRKVEVYQLTDEQLDRLIATEVARLTPGKEEEKGSP